MAVWSHLVGVGLCLHPEALLQVQLLPEALVLLGGHHGDYRQEGFALHTFLAIHPSHTCYYVQLFMQSNFRYINSVIKEQLGERSVVLGCPQADCVDHGHSHCHWGKWVLI